MGLGSVVANDAVTEMDIAMPASNFSLNFSFQISPELLPGLSYGEIAKLTNHSRDWVIMKLKSTVPFDTDLEKVRKIFKRIGQELMENPAHADNILAPFKSQGVADVNDVGIVLRGKFTAKPGTQFMVRKDIYNMVQKAFDENGIQFARKEVRVNMSGIDDSSQLNETEKHVVAAAATEAAETADGQKKT